MTKIIGRIKDLPDILAALDATRPAKPQPPKGALSTREWADHWNLSHKRAGSLITDGLRAGLCKRYIRPGGYNGRGMPVYLFTAKPQTRPTK